MASQTKFPGTAATSAEAPWDDLDWDTPDNIKADDGNYAEYTGKALDPGVYMYIIKGTNFGFSIPNDATITGILVEHERKGTSNDIIDDLVQLIKGGTRQGDNKSLAAVWPVVEAIETFGSSSDLWGLSLSPSDVNAANFGVAASCTCAAGQKDGKTYIDFLRITVYYTGAKVTQYLAGLDCPSFPHDKDLIADKLPCALPWD